MDRCRVGHAGSPVSLPIVDAPHPGSERELIASESPLRLEPRQTAGAIIEFTSRSRGGVQPASRSRAMPSSRSWARSATGLSPRRPASSTSANRSAARASRTTALAGHLRDARSTPPARRRRTPARRSKRSTLPRSVAGCPAWANSQSSTPVTSSVSGSTSRFFGFRSLCTRQCRSTVSSSACASCGHLDQAGELRRRPVVQRDPLGLDPRRQVSGAVERADPQVGVDERPLPQHRHAAEGRGHLADRPAQPLLAGRVELRQHQVAADAREEGGDQQRRLVRPPGTPRRTSSTSGDGQQAAHQRAAARRRSPRPGRRGRRWVRAGRSGPPAARPPPRRGRSARTSRRRAASTRRSPLA